MVAHDSWAKVYDRAYKESFGSFYKATVEEAKMYTDDPTLPHCRRLPRRFDDGATPHSFSSPEEYYRSRWFYSIDLLVEEISDRFTQSSMCTVFQKK